MADETKPKSEAAKAKKAGFDAEGKPYPGVDPKTGERVTVTLDALKKEFGAKRGEEMYRQIARASGATDLFQRLDEYAPDISLAGASDSIRIQVDEVLAAKE